MNTISLILPDLIPGGAQKVFINLAGEFHKIGFNVELVILTNQGEYLNCIPEGTKKIVLCKKLHKFTPITYIIAFFKLHNFFRKNHQNLFLSSLTGTNLLSLTAKLLVFRHINLFIREANVLKNVTPSWVFFLMRLLYPHANKIICVSLGVKKDLKIVLRIAENKLIHIANPVNISKIQELSAHPATHPWLIDRKIPVVVAVGRLVQSKGFDVLIRAIAKLNTKIPTNLIIVGEGPLRPQLQAVIQELHLEKRVDLVGYQENPYNYIKCANLFVLSSNWEGFVNVLLEAITVGTPVIATDCHSGPSEILKNGELGTLVPVGDHSALAEAIYANLGSPPDTAPLLSRSTDFSINNIAHLYLTAIKAHT